MNRRGFLKALGGAAAVSVVGVPESHGVECYAMDSPLERLPLALQRQIMDNIYLASNPQIIRHEWVMEELKVFKDPARFVKAK